MSAQITVERSFPALDALELTTPEDMRQIGLLMRERIYARTVSGRDADNAPFAPYSADYAKRKLAELGTSTVNLQVSGNMLNHLQVTEIGSDTPDSTFVKLGWEQ